MTGRTGELARAFGIDFFSVLTRGSQYRVEAMMVRLAHTQNYVLPAPSKQQVPAWHDICHPCRKLHRSEQLPPESLASTPDRRGPCDTVLLHHVLLALSEGPLMR